MKKVKIVVLLVLLLLIFIAVKFFIFSSSQLHRANIILIVIDTLSAQYILNDKVRAESPNIQRMINEGISFRNAYSTAPWTRPAIASLFTGELPYRHQVRDLNSTFSEDFPTVAELLSDGGYATAGFVSHMLISEQTSFKRGFDHYVMVPLKESVHQAITSKIVTDSAIKWLKKEKKDRLSAPFFLFLHYFDPHYSYRHHQKFDRTSWYKGSLHYGYPFRKFRSQIGELSAEDVRYMQNLHQEEISYADQEIGLLLEYLRNDSALKSSIVILTADHGEEFAEHGGVGHGRTLYNEVLQVPLVIWSPDNIGKQVVNDWVSSADIMPTILDLATDSDPSHRPQYAKPLTGYFGGTSRASDELERTLFSEVDYNAALVSVMRKPFKLVHNKENNKSTLYNLDSDPKEKKDLMDVETDVLRELQAELKWFLYEQNLSAKDSSTQDSHNPADKEAIKKLRSLGYVGD